MGSDIRRLQELIDSLDKMIQAQKEEQVNNQNMNDNNTSNVPNENNNIIDGNASNQLNIENVE